MPEEIIKQHINLNLHGVRIAVRVLREEEELYRRAERFINSKVNTYYDLLNGKKPEKDILFAVMLDIAVALEKEKRRNDTAPFNELIGTLTKEIEDALKK